MELIAQGRDADVYALDETRVLRRYRRGGPTEQEARLMAHLAGCGYPVPRVHEAAGTDMVLERLVGPTMLEAIMRRPWRAAAYAPISRTPQPASPGACCCAGCAGDAPPIRRLGSPTRSARAWRTRI